MILRLKEASKGNIFLAVLEKMFNVPEEIAQWEKRKLELTALGGEHNVKIAEKFKAIGWHDEYNAIYRSLCDATHPNLSGIIERSFEIDLEKQDHEVVLYKPPQPETVTLICHTACKLLQEACKQMETARAKGVLN